MSDDDSPGGLLGMFFGQMKRDHDMTEMAIQASYHEMMNWITKQSDEDLRKLYNILKAPETVTNHWAGIIEGLMVSRGFCFICGTNHDESLEELVNSAKSEDVIEDIPDELKAQMDEYRLVPHHQYGLPQVKCRDCGMPYISIEDRMRRPPSHCEGCFHKAKFG